MGQSGAKWGKVKQNRTNAVDGDCKMGQSGAKWDKVGQNWIKSDKHCRWRIAKRDKVGQSGTKLDKLC